MSVCVCVCVCVLSLLSCVPCNVPYYAVRTTTCLACVCVCACSPCCPVCPAMCPTMLYAQQHALLVCVCVCVCALLVVLCALHCALLCCTHTTCLACMCVCVCVHRFSTGDAGVYIGCQDLFLSEVSGRFEVRCRRVSARDALQTLSLFACYTFH